MARRIVDVGLQPAAGDPRLPAVEPFNLRAGDNVDQPGVGDGAAPGEVEGGQPAERAQLEEAGICQVPAARQRQPNQLGEVVADMAEGMVRDFCSAQRQPP